MSQVKNLIEGIVSLVEHINATPVKLGVMRASMIGEFDADQLRLMAEKVDRCRWRLVVLQSELEYCYRKLTNMDNQLDIFNSSTVPASSAAVPRDHRVNGSAD